MESTGRSRRSPWQGSDALLYFDPPYLPSTRTKRRIYKHEMTADDHRRLLDAAAALSCLVMISGYPSRMYDDSLAGWHRFTRPTMTRGGVLRDETVWCNFDPARASTKLAREYSALGGNFRERERVARKVRRWRGKFESLPADERRAILGELIDCEFEASIAGCGDAVPDCRK